MYRTQQWKVWSAAAVHIAMWQLDRHTKSFYKEIRYIACTGIACWLEHRTRGWKFVSSKPSWSGRRIFFSRVNFVLLEWHVKDPSHSAKSADGRLYVNMRTPLTQQSWSGLTMPLSRHSVGTYQEASSHATHQLTEPLWTDPDLKSGISVRKLISTLKIFLKSTHGK